MGEITAPVSPRANSLEVVRAYHLPALAEGSVAVYRFDYPKAASVWPWPVTLFYDSGDVDLLSIGVVRSLHRRSVTVLGKGCGQDTLVVSDAGGKLYGTPDTRVARRHFSTI